GISPAERTSSCASFHSSVMTYGTATGTNGLIVPVTFSVPWSGFSPKKPPTNVPLPKSVTLPNGPGGGVTGEPSGGSVDSTKLRSELLVTSPTGVSIVDAKCRVIGKEILPASYVPVPPPMRVIVVVPGPKGVSNAAPSAGKVSMLILAGFPPTCN